MLQIEVNMILRKITILLILLSIPLCANASDKKGWYSFLGKKGWYAWENQSISTASSGETEKSMITPISQSAANSTQSTFNTSSQTGNQPAQSSGFK